MPKALTEKNINRYFTVSRLRRWVDHHSGTPIEDGLFGFRFCSTSSSLTGDLENLVFTGKTYEEIFVKFLEWCEKSYALKWRLGELKLKNILRYHETPGHILMDELSESFITFQNNGTIDYYENGEAVNLPMDAAIDLCIETLLFAKCLYFGVCDKAIFKFPEDAFFWAQPVTLV